MPAGAGKRRRGEQQDPRAAAVRGLRLALTVLAASLCLLERAAGAHQPGADIVVETLAGGYHAKEDNPADGVGASAVLYGSPIGLDVWWPSGASVLFLGNCPDVDCEKSIRRLQVATREVTTLAEVRFFDWGGASTASKLRVAPDGAAAYIVNQHSIYRVDLASMDLASSENPVPSTPWVGTNSAPADDITDAASQRDAVGTNAGFHTILWTDFTPDGANLIVLEGHPEGTDSEYRVKLRRVSCDTAQVTTVGFVHHPDGTLLKDPRSLAVSPDGQSVFIAERGRHRIVKADISADKSYDYGSNLGDQMVCGGYDHCTWCGSQPQADYSWIGGTSGCAITAEVVAGSASGSGGYADGMGTHASFYFPRTLDVSPDGTELLVTEADGDGSLGGTIRALEISSNSVSTIAGSPGAKCDWCSTCDATSCDGDHADALFYAASGAVYGTDKTQIYVGDFQMIRRIGPAALVEDAVPSPPDAPTV